ncbi:antitoxin [Flexivirga oryzae]|uniref:Antitoxin n=1 Tax=Flexivirga oryzae TaxID=1794944 RepID=A0A839N2I5_9MICO|nr:antitoxin [Flexivirga oryzae]MBB2891928.1 hypothetical protein [Flexivirga oryzae]
MVDFSSLVQKAKDFARKNPDKVREGVSKAEDVVDEKTGGKYESQVNAAGEQVEKQLGVQPEDGNNQK